MLIYLAKSTALVSPICLRAVVPKLRAMNQFQVSFEAPRAAILKK